MTMGEYPVYVNAVQSRIRFGYDGNPRGYFGEENEVVHVTNSDGFRGDDFSPIKAPGTVRLLCLGDSVTFGEGVRFEHTFPEITAELLNDKFGDSSLNVEAYNLGVGGYNTSQSEFLFNLLVEQLAPDVVVLGYFPNDPEPPLFEFDPMTQSVVRADRPAEIWEGCDDPQPPSSLLRMSRVSQLVWRFTDARRRTEQTMRYYHALFDEENSGWRESRQALRKIKEQCDRRSLPLLIVLFPVLYSLNDDYPLADIHARLAEEAQRLDVMFLDLLPLFKEHQAADLWVHPTDQHPNEIAQKIAAQAIADRLLPELKAIGNRAAQNQPATE